MSFSWRRGTRHLGLHSPFIVVRRSWKTGCPGTGSTPAISGWSAFYERLYDWLLRVRQPYPSIDVHFSTAFVICFQIECYSMKLCLLLWCLYVLGVSWPTPVFFIASFTYLFEQALLIARNKLMWQVFCRLPCVVTGTIAVLLSSTQRALAVDSAVGDFIKDIFVVSCWSSLPIGVCCSQIFARTASSFAVKDGPSFSVAISIFFL